jgi:tetratricopeptide (TPR) repeat protein
LHAVYFTLFIMRTFSALLFCLLLSFIGYSQDLKLSLTVNPFFYSPLEETAFQQLQAQDFESQFLLLYAITPSVKQDEANTHAKKLHDFIEELRPKIEKIRKPEKKIKRIHKEVHKTFLKKYVLQNHFSGIFIKGEYNCVSATALYALVLEQLHIPFTLKETPTHVFLVSYPQTERIALESTDPQIGYMVFNDKFKSEYISQLRKMKLISEQEFQTKSLNTLFEEMYFENQDISFQELIALQYYNDGLYQIEKEEFQRSLLQFEKAYQLYPSSRIAYLIYSTTVLGMEKKTFSDSLYIDYLARLSNMNGVENLREITKGEFARFTLDQLTNKSQLAYYDRMYEKLLGQVQDSLLAKEISHIYYYEKSRVAYNKGEFTTALQHIEQAYRLFPLDTDNMALLTSCLGQKLNTIQLLDEKTRFLEGFLGTYPPLRENNMIYSQLLQFYLLQFGQAYELSHHKKGKEFRQRFEEAYKQNKASGEGYLLDRNLIGRAYSIAAVYYFRKGQTAYSRQLLDKGLSYAPDNLELLQRKRMIR